MSSYRKANLDEIAAKKWPHWMPVRHYFSIDAFGVNAYRAKAGGNTVPEHDETDSDHVELFYVATGGATFTVDALEHERALALQTALDVRRICLRVRRARRAAPDACDHSPPSRYFVSQPEGLYSLPCAPAPIESTIVSSAVANATRSAFGSSTHTNSTADASTSSPAIVNFAAPLITT